jgi:hypothetical protein
MILQSKMDELHAFLSKQDEERSAFLKKWEEGMREELGLPRSPMSRLGLSFDPSTTFTKLPPVQDVSAGIYHNREGLTVEVTSQDPESKLLVLEMPAYVPARDRLQTMSVGIFNELFVPAEPMAVVKSVELVNQEFEYQTDPGKREHLMAWKENFDWTAITTQYEALCDKFVKLDRALAAKDKDSTQMYFLEVVFLFYVLGNRLGYSAAFHFRALHESIFSLVDHNPEAALRTQNYYLSQAIETEYREVQLYNPLDVMKLPEKYYLTYSAKDQGSPDGGALPKGCFLRSRA